MDLRIRNRMPRCLSFYVQVKDIMPKKTRRSSGAHELPPTPRYTTDTSEYEGGFTVDEELLWCRDKLLTTLPVKHTDSRAVKPIMIALKALDKRNNPLPKLRQIMRAGCGDYRAEMQEEYEIVKADTKKFSLIKQKPFKGRKVAVTRSKKSKETEPQNNESTNLDNVPFCFNFPSPADDMTSET